MVNKIFVFSLVLLGCTSAVVADITAEEKIKINAAIQKVGKKVNQNLQVDSIKPTPIPNLYQIISGATVLYISNDGKYLLSGEFIDIDLPREDWSLTQQAAGSARANVINSIAKADMVIYPATTNKLAHVTIFTDIDCGYCRKLHAEMDEYNKHGIEIRYLAYPRSGPGSESFAKAVGVWCADDRTAMMDLAKAGKDVPKKTCTNPVKEQFALGQQMGVRGTPTMIFANGDLVPGYLPVKELVKVIKEITD